MLGSPVDFEDPATDPLTVTAITDGRLSDEERSSPNPDQVRRVRANTTPEPIVVNGASSGKCHDKADRPRPDPSAVGDIWCHLTAIPTVVVGIALR